MASGNRRRFTPKSLSARNDEDGAPFVQEFEELERKPRPFK